MATTTASPASRSLQRLFCKSSPSQAPSKLLLQTTPLKSNLFLDLLSPRSLLPRGGLKWLHSSKLLRNRSRQFSTQDICFSGYQRAFQQLRCTRPTVRTAAFSADRSNPLPDAGAYRKSTAQRPSEEDSLKREIDGERTGAEWRRDSVERSAGPVLPDTREFLSFERNVKVAIDPESIQQAVRIRPEDRLRKQKQKAAQPPWVAAAWVLAGLALCAFSWRVAKLGGGDIHEPPIATVELDSRPQKGLWAEQLKKAQAEDGFREQLLGHFRTEEAPKDDLVKLLRDGTVKLRSAAAYSFFAMQQAAWKEGVQLLPISGFRSIEDQKDVFFGIKAERNQSAKERAKVSAPPGYSEHHTGYALDIGDAKAANTDLEFTFDQTSAFEWLQRNGAKFHFEMSFPRDNPYGVAYEPWHWRYVGNVHSLQMFHGHERVNSFPASDATART
ncbi:Peptidase M15B and M15C [Klebsormidium nitens]|uniref:Peptidase M15B and M15C n=1 Tax=Klebsormidium nitens TaxID=105231 RepID=A0A1Y1HKN0_KLENI|nr:Peptidase M15B and M15C [Klebsormidium nitens]|eukprot:GAQ79155.1 Peptidase M15B and M15C [Klebsormidium nitens]